MRVLIKGMILSACIYTTVANAADFQTNGNVAKLLESAMETYILQKGVSDAAYNVYLQPGGTAAGSRTTTEDPKNYFVTRHAKYYCSPNIPLEVSAFNCSAPGNMGDLDKAYVEMGDITASVLTEPSLYTSITDLAAQDYIRTITMPFPEYRYKNAIGDKGFMNNSGSKEDYANYMANMATMGAALNALNNIYVRRLPGSTMSAGGNANAVSLMQTMEDEATQRFEKPDFYNNLNSADQLTVLKEIAKINAVQLWMDYQAYRQNETIVTLLSACLAKFVSNSIAQDKLANRR